MGDEAEDPSLAPPQRRHRSVGRIAQAQAMSRGSRGSGAFARQSMSSTASEPTPRSVSGASQIPERLPIHLMDMIATCQGDRLEHQRFSSTTTLATLYADDHADLKRIRSASSIASLSRTTSREQQQMYAVALERACRFHSQLPPIRGDVPDAIVQRSDGPCELVGASSGWILETGTEAVNNPILLSSANDGFEYADPHILWYREFFFDQDHQTILGEDEKLGALVISLRREQTETGMEYRAIVRSTKRGITRIILPELFVPDESSSTPSWNPKYVVARILPEVPTSNLMLAQISPKLNKAVLQLDEIGIHEGAYKFGILFCADGQTTEQEMLNNSQGSLAFEKFLQAMGDRVPLQNFSGYSAGLDTSEQLLTGESTVATVFKQKQVTYHVSTLLPHSDEDQQQVQKKRHIGNNIVNIIFLESGAAGPVDLSSFVSQFNHIFIIVQAVGTQTKNMWQVAIATKSIVPAFGPRLPPTTLFNSDNTDELRELVLTKAINAEHAALSSGQFLRLGQRTFEACMQDIVKTHSSEIALNSLSKRTSFAKLFSRKPALFSQFAKDAPSWRVKLDILQPTKSEPTGTPPKDAKHVTVPANLGISDSMVLVADDTTQAVLHSFPTSAVIGWRFLPNGLELWFGASQDRLVVLCSVEDQTSIASELGTKTSGCQIVERVLTKRQEDRWGFTVDGEVITAVAEGSVAASSSITKDCKLFRLNNKPVINMTSTELSAAASENPTSARLLLKLPQYLTRNAHGSESPVSSHLRDFDKTPRRADRPRGGARSRRAASEHSVLSEASTPPSASTSFETAQAPVSIHEWDMAQRRIRELEKQVRQLQNRRTLDQARIQDLERTLATYTAGSLDTIVPVSPQSTGSRGARAPSHQVSRGGGQRGSRSPTDRSRTLPAHSPRLETSMEHSLQHFHQPPSSPRTRSTLPRARPQSNHTSPVSSPLDPASHRTPYRALPENPRHVLHLGNPHMESVARGISLDSVESTNV
eukprot:m.5805 g.5805  ORF g.5805 m.5805 type:complete len:991 (-) comp5090_c0_seq1:384-3356(-)